MRHETPEIMNPDSDPRTRRMFSRTVSDYLYDESPRTMPTENLDQTAREAILRRFNQEIDSQADAAVMEYIRWSQHNNREGENFFLLDRNGRTVPLSEAELSPQASPTFGTLPDGRRCMVLQTRDGPGFLMQDPRGRPWRYSVDHSMSFRRSVDFLTHLHLSASRGGLSASHWTAQLPLQEWSAISSAIINVGTRLDPRRRTPLREDIADSRQGLQHDQEASTLHLTNAELLSHPSTHYFELAEIADGGRWTRREDEAMALESGAVGGDRELYRHAGAHSPPRPPRASGSFDADLEDGGRDEHGDTAGDGDGTQAIPHSRRPQRNGSRSDGSPERSEGQGEGQERDQSEGKRPEPQPQQQEGEQPPEQERESTPPEHEPPANDLEAIARAQAVAREIRALHDARSRLVSAGIGVGPETVRRSRLASETVALGRIAEEFASGAITTEQAAELLRTALRGFEINADNADDILGIITDRAGELRDSIDDVGDARAERIGKVRTTPTVLDDDALRLALDDVLASLSNWSQRVTGQAVADYSRLRGHPEVENPPTTPMPTRAVTSAACPTGRPGLFRRAAEYFRSLRAQ
jgi:hypothetical protein